MSLRTLAAARGLTLTALARRLGVSARSLRRYDAGAPLPLELAERLWGEDGLLACHWSELLPEGSGRPTKREGRRPARQPAAATGEEA